MDGSFQWAKRTRKMRRRTPKEQTANGQLRIYELALKQLSNSSQEEPANCRLLDEVYGFCRIPLLAPTCLRPSMPAAVLASTIVNASYCFITQNNG